MFVDQRFEFGLDSLAQGEEVEDSAVGLTEDPGAEQEIMGVDGAGSVGRRGWRGILSGCPEGGEAVAAVMEVAASGSRLPWSGGHSSACPQAISGEHTANTQSNDAFVVQTPVSELGVACSSLPLNFLGGGRPRK